VQVFWLNRIISTMHLLALVSNDFHSSHRINSRSPEIGTRSMSEIVNGQPAILPPTPNTRPATSRSKGRPRVLPGLPFIQEDPIGV
jgi:hypothetical protein